MSFYQVVTTTGRFPNESLEIRSFQTTQEIEVAQKQSALRYPSIRPNSVYIAAIGCNWSPGSWQKVVDMFHYTNEQGICCWLTEFPDRCVTLPYDAVGQLKDSACLTALDAGFEWILLIDNDILPEPDMLVKLLDWGMPIIVPLMIDHKLHLTLSSPNYPSNSGIHRVKWSALSCILMRTKVLNCFHPGTLFTKQVLEPEFYEKLSHFGHEVYIDTNTELKLAQNPSYPGDLETLSDKWAVMDRADRKRKMLPDRKPIDAKDTRDTYFPDVLVVEPDEPPQVVTGEVKATPKKKRSKKVTTDEK